MPGRGDRDRGASPIELAVLLPAIILALFLSIQVAVYFLARSEALAAAQEGVTAQRAYRASDGIGATRANSFIAHSQGWLVNSAPHVTTDATGVTVTVSGSALSLIPGVTWTVSQSAHGTIERVTTPGGP
jgi:Flp pilus assembly protein TadG